MKRNARRNILLWTLIGLTLCYIWGNSLLPAEASGAFSTAVKEWLNQLLSLFFPGEGITDTGLLRKSAHAIEFAVFGAEVTLLFAPAFLRRLPIVAAFGVFVPLIDETIQLFVEGRAGQVRDIWIDMGGFTVGVLLAYAIYRACVAYRLRKKV